MANKRHARATPVSRPSEPPRERAMRSLDVAYQRHPRHWRQNVYCYPVVSRRSGGLSVGVNLNPDKGCNFGCVYCQVDRAVPPMVRKVDLTRLAAELNYLLDAATDESLFAEPPFDRLGPDQRAVCDIAFSGDGEPTAYPRFGEALRIAAEARQSRGLSGTKLVLITNACYLSRPKVRQALGVLDRNNGEIWAKLDAGTEEYYKQVNRASFPLAHVLENLLDAARARPIVIQSLWMRLHGEPPPPTEVRAFAERLVELIAADGHIKLVQVYTVARQTTEPYVAPLSDSQLAAVAAMIRQIVNLPLELYPGPA